MPRSQLSFETFLVEDVILTLTNLRSAVAWLSGPAGEAERGAVTARLAAQIASLDARARALVRAMPVVPPGPARTDESGGEIVNIFDTGAEPDTPPAFRSRRTTAPLPAAARRG